MSDKTFWVFSWCKQLGISDQLPEWFYATLALICTYCFVIVPCGSVMAYLERKFTADLQARVGPNRAGPKGVLQPFADLLKLLQKGADLEWSWRDSVWLSVHSMAMYSTLAVLPLGSVALLVDSEMNAFLPFWSALVLALGTMLLGLGQGSIPGWFGGIRIAAQTLAGCFPSFIALLCAGVRTGEFRWSALAASQGFFPLSWAVFSNPFQFIAFFIFVMSGLVFLAIPPLDGGMSMSDIHGGVASHLFGRRLSLFRLGRFYGFFLWSVISVVLFLGAWRLPEGLTQLLKESDAIGLLAFLELLVLLAKTFILMLIIIIAARVNTRGRVDQITGFAWKVLSPFALFALVGASLWAGWRAL